MSGECPNCGHDYMYKQSSANKVHDIYVQYVNGKNQAINSTIIKVKQYQYKSGNDSSTIYLRNCVRFEFADVQMSYMDILDNPNKSVSIRNPFYNPALAKNLLNKFALIPVLVQSSEKKIWAKSTSSTIETGWRDIKKAIKGHPMILAQKTHEYLWKETESSMYIYILL